MNNIKAIFFDLDDTLINFGGVTHQAWKLTCQKLLEEKHDLTIDPFILAKQINKINDAYWSDEESRPKGNIDFQKVRKGILQQAFNACHIENEEAIEFLLAHYSVYKEEAIYLYSDVYETLESFQSQGYKLVLITNGDGTRQRGKIARFDLEKYFDFILIEGEQGFGKPDLRIYQKALDLCHVLSSEACMVGDNYLWEVKTPIEYGMKAVWVNRNHQQLPKKDVHPDMVIEHISQLKNIFS